MTSPQEKSDKESMVSETSVDTAKEIKKLVEAPEPTLREIIKQMRVAINPATLVFDKNPYNITPENFWKFEIFFTKSEIDFFLKANNKIIDTQFIENIGRTLIIPFYYSKADHALLSTKENYVSPENLEEMTFLEALKLYSIDALEKTKEEGIYYLNHT